MGAFRVTLVAIKRYYNDLFFMVGISGLWWLTGGIFAGLAILAAGLSIAADGPIWLAPLLAIPAGPAGAALAHVTDRIARDLSADRSDYWEGWRTHWRRALALNAISMALLAMLLLNWQFYSVQPSDILRAFSIAWLISALYWLAAQLTLIPVLASLEEPRVLTALRMGAMLPLVTPIFTLLLLLIAVLLTGISILLPLLLFVTWPALMSLLGEGAWRLVVTQARAKVKPEETGEVEGEAQEE